MFWSDLIKFSFAFIFMCIVVGIVTEGKARKDKRAACEAELPRTQHCVQIWVPEEIK